MPTTTELTEEYIKKHPSIKDCLKKGLINYSALSRLVAADLGVSNSKKSTNEAILIAARRFKDKLKNEAINEDKIVALLKETEFEIKTKTVVVVIEKLLFPERLLDLQKEIKRKRDLFHVIEGTRAIIVITSEKYLRDLKKSFRTNILSVTTELVSLVMQSSKKIETTPGVMAYVYSLFGENGINICETLSCWTDTIIVIHENDLAKAMTVLKF
ncbi:ACT domain-containing protein [Candidatus Woesearchaeota archaeon]|jgi:aspartokinase|nr:ACT domain-containing protein [Candidatus Woesearchaeota archaeon]MBT6518286.1 ACT domain-containing protein [Candidatus Woesearchaeota archaeon]MBT7367069.1 ACT domain-containing protein [Candidatus Woesearchaeota archaeon]